MSSMLCKAGGAFLARWHGLLALPAQSPPSWYRDRYKEEVQEYLEAVTPLERLSEESDVFFALSRAKHDGHPVAPLPPFQARHLVVYGYMVAKYTSRWGFYRVLAILCRVPNAGTIREVVNASKDSKLETVARRHEIDPVKFTAMGRKLRRVWPLFP